MGVLSNLKKLWQNRQEKIEAEKAKIEAKKAEEAALIEELKRLTKKLRNGALPTPMTPDGRIILDKGEEVYLIINNLMYLEDRTSRVNYGGGGASFHVAKGVTLRSMGGTAVPVHNLTVIDRGSLYITDKKVAFIGAKKNVVFPLKKIAACNYGNNELHVASSTKKTPIIVRSVKQSPEAWDYADAVVKSLIAHT